MYLEHAPAVPQATFLFAHGAGAPMDSPFMEAVTERLVASGVRVIRFEFPYMRAIRAEGKRRPPDRQEKLLDCWRQVIQDFSAEDRLYIGGKSMGGRMATLVTCETSSVAAGVVCFGYPFHPPGKPDRLRIDHFQRLGRPLLILQGERDPFGARAEIESLSLADPVTLNWVPEGNHDLTPPRRSVATLDSNLALACKAAAEFMGCR